MAQLYSANINRYECGMEYERLGRSGILLPKVSLAFWHNFGGQDSYDRSREITRYAFDNGIVRAGKALYVGISRWPLVGASSISQLKTNLSAI